MQHMPDKEFDQLFREQFMNAEIEPSANLWSKIEQQLEPKRKRAFPVYWMAAASVAVAFTAMMLFQQPEKIQLQGQPAVTVEQQAALPVTSSEAEHTAMDSAVPAAKPVFAVTGITARQLSPVKNDGAENIPANITLSMQPQEDFARLPIKQADPKPMDVLPVTAAQTENPLMIAQVDPQRTESNVISETDHVTERKGIRNVGDLVNYVVDKVDKRDKKLVRFNTDDDDNSSIVAINIGFLKLNKKDR